MADLRDGLERIGRYTGGSPAGMDARLRLVAILHELGREDEALAEAQQALATAGNWGTNGKLGAALRRAGRRADSREPLRTGLDLAERACAAPLADHARAELAAGGIRVPRQRVGDQLTPSEQRIVEMAARGATNPQIAQALFVTTKTVESHLANAYRKLGISSRRELHSSPRSG